MPALKVIGLCGTGRKLTTRPFAGDDLHVLCVLAATYRVIQMACIIPFWVRLFLYRLRGTFFVGPDGRPSWCVDEYHRESDPSAVILWFNDTSSPDEEETSVALERSIDTSRITFFLFISALYTVLDIILSLATWSAASVGTPTEPRGRDASLRWLLWIRVGFMNLLLAVALTSGILFVNKARGSNYGCGDVGVDAAYNFESSTWYMMFCVVMVTYALELLLWPCIIVNQISKTIMSETEKTIFFRNKDGRHEAMAAFMGGCFKCLQCLCCNRLGGGNIRAQIHLKDAAVAIMEFFNDDDAGFDIVMSDMLLAFKIMGRVHREQKYLLSERVRLDKRRSILGQRQMESCAMGDITVDAGVAEGEGCDANTDGEDLIRRTTTQENDFDDILVAEAKYHKQISPMNIASNRENHTYSAKESVRLRQCLTSDMYHIRQVARYAHYALGVYDHYPVALLGQLVGGRSGIYQPLHTMGRENHVGADLLSSCFRLTDYGFPLTALVYATLSSDVIQTPYAVLVDEQEKTIVVSIRGTHSIEDLATDLQFNSSNMSRVGEVCGFDGSNMLVHRGMLTRCKWIYNDLTKRKILARLLPTGEKKRINNPCHDFNLIITGHSLGAGIAAILGTMFRPKYPRLRCYAFCPPGCSVSPNLALQCEEYVTTVVVGSDVIPRIRGSNFEMLRFEFLELLTRVKVSKKKAWRDTSIPCKDKDLEARNKKILYPKGQVPKSDYSKELESFYKRRKRVFTEMNPIESRLDIPGRIIHLVKCSDKYVPHWASLLSLRDIELSINAIKEHSMDNVVPILERIVADYENSLRGMSQSRVISTVDDDGPDVSNDSASFDESKDELSVFSADDRWFIICSRPHGSVSLIPMVLSLAGFACSILSNNMCSLFTREIAGENVDYDFILANGDVRDVAGFVFGLYTFGLMYYQGDTDDSVVTQCYATFPIHVELDAYIKLARGMSVLSLIIGFLATCFLLFANCMILGWRIFRRASVALFVVTFFQSMVFSFLFSERCYKVLIPQEHMHEAYLESCRLNGGSLIAAIVLWFLAASFTAYIAQTGFAEEQAKAVSVVATHNDGSTEIVE